MLLPDAAASSILVFEMAGHAFGVYGSEVHEILRAALPSPLAGAPAVVIGLLDVRGALLPVFDVRSRFRLEPRAMRAADHMIVVSTARGRAVLAVERVVGLVDVPEADIERAAALPTTSEGVAGVARLPDGTAMILDLRTFLSEAEAIRLDAALER